MILYIIFIFLVVLFVVGLIFFLRSLFQKKHLGCGLFGFLAMLPLVYVIWFITYGFHHQTKREFICDFEHYTGLSFPPSGKIVEKMHESGYLDSETAGIIQMDTQDYEKMLHQYRSRMLNAFPDGNFHDEKKASSYRLKTQFPASECEYGFFGYRVTLWFHTNKRIVVFEGINY